VEEGRLPGLLWLLCLMRAQVGAGELSGWPLPLSSAVKQASNWPHLPQEHDGRKGN